MPSASIELLEQVSTLLPSAANEFAIAGVCSKGIVSQEYVYEPGASPADIRSDLGDGDAVEALVSHLRYGRRRAAFFPLPSDVAGTIGSVTKTRPSNPLAIISATLTPSAIAASGDVLENGPYHSLDVCIKVTTAGAGGTGKMAYSLDHQIVDGELVGTFSGDITIPVAKAAVVVGTVDVSTLNTAVDLDTLTFIIDTDSDGGSPVTTTFSAPANAAAVVTQLNANNGGGTKYLAALVGANKLAIYSITASGSGTVTINNGTANTLLGFTNGQTATGSAATYDIPNTGIRITASGTFVKDDYYTFSTVAPKVATTALSGLFTRITDKIADGEPIGAVWLVQEDADAIDAKSMLDELSTQLSDARTDKFFLWGLYQMPREETDANIITYASSFTDPYIVCSAGDARVKGGLLTGSRFHRPASWIGAWKAARDRFSSDLGNHSDRVLDSAFGVTEIGARDERTATVKLATYRSAQTQDGGGFLVLETMPNTGDVYFYRGRTMAQAGSILGDAGSMRLLLTSARQIQSDLDRQINTDPPVRSDGSLVEVDTIKSQLEAPLRVVLFEDSEAPAGHASALSLSDPTYNSNTKTMSVSFEVQRNAQVKAVSATLGVVDVLSVNEVA